MGNWFKNLCKINIKLNFFGPVSEEERTYLDFRGWKLSDEEYRRGQSVGVILAFFLGVLFSLYLFFFQPDLLEEFGYFIVIFPPIVLTILGYLFFKYIWKIGIEQEILLFCCELPETLGYLAVYLKLIPNMEKAVEYVIHASKSRLANKFKEILWEFKLGYYTSIEEALDKLSYKWGKLVPEFRFTMMKIRSSIVESDNTKRELILDQAMNSLLESVKFRLLTWADSLKTPSTIIFFLGVFLPLLLVVLLPVASFANMELLNNPYFAGFLFDVLIPLFVFMYMNSIISFRPKFFEIPKISEPFSNILPSMFIFGVVFIICAGISYYLHLQIDNTYEKVSEELYGDPEAYKYKPEWEYDKNLYDFTPYILVLGSFVSFCIAFSVAVKNLIKDKLKLQQEYIELENELTSSIYFLASRLAEFKPLEECILATAEMVREGKIKELFNKIVYNIKYLGLTLEDALFNKVFGAVVNIPSEKVKHIMKIVAESTYLGPEQAAKNLMSIATQLQNQQQVMENIYRKTEEITSTMIIMALFIIPIILGIATSLEKVLANTFKNIQISSISEESIHIEGYSLLKLFTKKSEISLTPFHFLIMMMIYIIIVDCLIVYFTVSLQTGFDYLQFLDKLTNILPISSICYSIVVIALNLLIGIFI